VIYRACCAHTNPAARALIANGRVSHSEENRREQVLKNPGPMPHHDGLGDLDAYASTRSQPKNSIETIVAVTERTTATMLKSSTPIPNARNHPQYSTMSGGQR